MNLYQGVIYHKEDIGNGPFILRQSGTNNFVTNITTNYYSRFGNPAAHVVFGKGWDNPSLLVYRTMEDAIEAAIAVYEIEGTFISIETKNP